MTVSGLKYQVLSTRPPSPALPGLPPTVAALAGGEIRARLLPLETRGPVLSPSP